MATESYDRAKEIKQFDETKYGVKGLADSSITTIPRFFIHPPEILSELRSKSTGRPDPDIIPVIDVSGADSDKLRPTIVDKIARASREIGFFQVVNHGIGVQFFDRVIGAIKGFHEQPAEIKARFYSRDEARGVWFLPNLYFDTKAATWSDKLRMNLGAILPEVDEIPEICRNEVVEWNQHMIQFGKLLMGLLSEGLGLETGRLKEMKLFKNRAMIGQYYPYCPQPDLTLGLTPHSDAVALTILLQNQIGGLQIKHAEKWVDVQAVPGALLVNIGDVLQIMSNDEYKSVEHRVLANTSPEPRIAVPFFFKLCDDDTLYGPLPELITSEKPPRFRSFTYTEFVKGYRSMNREGKSVRDYFRLPE